MERRGEGFEREHVPDLSKAAREQAQPERHEALRGEERSAAPMLGDLPHWSALWSGFFVALSVTVLIGALGLALGLTSAAGAAIWGAITLIVGFFCGGWFAARGISRPNVETVILHGVGVWAITTVALIVLGIMGGAGLLGGLGMDLGALRGMPGTPVSPTQLTGWGLFAGLILGLIACGFGGYVGSLYRRIVPERGTRSWR